MKWHLQSVRNLVRHFALMDDCHVLLTLSTLERKIDTLPSPLPVNNVVRLFKRFLENNKEDCES